MSHTAAAGTDNQQDLPKQEIRVIGTPMTPQTLTQVQTMRAFIWISNPTLPNYSIFDQPDNMKALFRSSLRKNYKGCEERFHRNREWRKLQRADGYGEQIMQQIDKWNIRDSFDNYDISEIPQDHMDLMIQRSSKSPDTEDYKKLPKWVKENRIGLHDIPQEPRQDDLPRPETTPLPPSSNSTPMHSPQPPQGDDDEDD